MMELKKVATEKAPAAIGPYSQAMICGEMVFTSGQIAINPASGNVEATTIEAQAEQVMKNLGEVLSAAGSSFEKAVKQPVSLRTWVTLRRSTQSTRSISPPALQEAVWR